MKKTTILLIVTLISLSSIAQSTIDKAYHYKKNDPIIINPPIGTTAQAGPDYGCLGTFLNRPFWFYITPCGGNAQPADLYLNVSYNGANTPYDVAKAIIWGPFDDTINIASKLTTSNIVFCQPLSELVPIFGISISNLVYPKVYYGMIVMDDNVTSLDMTDAGPSTIWYDGRCGLCNSQVANYKQDICMVTIDSATQKNMVIWEKTNNAQIASFNIYREGSVLGQFDLIGNVPVTSPGLFIDQGVNPKQKAYKYTISGVDSCGKTTLTYDPSSSSVSALVHQTIHVNASLGFLGEVNLSWNAYVGFNYLTFYIYRGSSLTNLQVIDSIASNTFAYTDYTPLPGLNYYRVSVKNSAGCSPDGSSTYYFSRSGESYANIVGIEELNGASFVKVFPNPLTSSSILQFNAINDAEVIIYDMLGNEMMRKKMNGNSMEIEKGSLVSGVYFVKVNTSEKQFVQKIVVE